MALFTSNIDDIAIFFRGINPHFAKDAARDLSSAHVDHHVVQINKVKRKLRRRGRALAGDGHHIYVLADALTTALVKQFPTKFM